MKSFIVCVLIFCKNIAVCRCVMTVSVCVDREIGFRVADVCFL